PAGEGGVECSSESAAARGSATPPPPPPGRGERLGVGPPKAFVELAGRPMLEWSLEALAATGSIDRILVTVPEDVGAHASLDAEEVEAVAGGPSRSQSVANAIERVESELVVVHDAARPLATAELFDAIVAGLEAEPELAGLIVATPVTDTTKEVLRGARIQRTLDRSTLWAAQTPQVFRTDALRDALGATELIAQASDDAMLVERNGGRVDVHRAPPANIKVTSASDLRLAELLLAERERF
ncbi:MAG: 2-C-methyl-D-erythritol 4-phosphate cytidylyltransferase, partial [Solirubrobacterales bacterium]